MQRLLFCLLGIVLAGSAQAADITKLRCEPVAASYWIGAVRIDVPAKTAWIAVKGEPGEHEAALLYIGPEQFGGRTYHFNWRVEGSEDHVVNAFKLFRTNEGWRLIDVGLQDSAGSLVLKALGDSQPMKCK